LEEFVRRTLLLVLCLSLGVPAFAETGDKERERLADSGQAMKEILDIPDGIPGELLDKAECVVVLPSVKKLAFGVGASYGRGAMTCRTGANFTAAWGSPVMMALEGGSIGFQLGGEATDFILLFMNPRAARAVLRSKVKLGADATAAAGPKGRSAHAATDATMRAEILSYSRSRGLFAGISLSGSTLRPDGGANENLYGRKVNARQLAATPGGGNAAAMLITILNSKSAVTKSDPKSLQAVKR
jgi:lipid-binding SYLF domain-containing protein